MNKDSYTLVEAMVEVDDTHQLYAQLWGNPEAKQTIVFLHGGPGSGCSDGHKQLFNPKVHRVIFFDQRGCGKSLPYGELKGNDTDSLVSDITAVAVHFEVERFALTGGSWGSLLALVYAIRNPEKVTHMVLRGLFTGRKSEIDFVDNGSIEPFFPDIWAEFLNTVPEAERSNMRGYHMKRLFGEDKQASLESALAYDNLESALLKLDDRFRPSTLDDFDPVPTTIECHYLENQCFIPEGYIQDNASKLAMPIDLVQGRYDFVCPPITAYELHKLMPGSTLTWTQAGHSGSDRANYEVVKALLAEV